VLYTLGYLLKNEEIRLLKAKCYARQGPNGTVVEFIGVSNGP
jgi:hypothetical protein